MAYPNGNCLRSTISSATMRSSPEVDSTRGGDVGRSDPELILRFSVAVEGMTSVGVGGSEEKVREALRGSSLFSIVPPFGAGCRVGVIVDTGTAEGETEVVLHGLAAGPDMRYIDLNVPSATEKSADSSTLDLSPFDNCQTQS